MGINLIIAQACAVPQSGSETAQHADVGDKVEVDSKDDALLLCRMGRAYYLDKAQDPTKGQLTASKEDQETIKRHAAAIEAESKRRATEAAATTPGGLAALVAAQVAAAVQAALKPAA